MRLISGKYARKKIHLPPEALTRPTSGKVREAIFNILAHLGEETFRLEEAIVLDAFAGSGALGLEALSQGAARAYFMEKNPSVLKILRHNVFSIASLQEAFVIGSDALHPKKAKESCSLIFLDPPYGKGFVETSLQALLNKGWIGEKTILVIECGYRDVLTLSPSVTILVEKKYGDTRLIIGLFSHKP